MKNGKQAATSIINTGLPVLVTIAVSGANRLCFHFDVATQNLNDFDVLGRVHPDQALFDFTPANWASLPGGNDRMWKASGNLAAQAAATKGYFEMDVRGLIEVQVKCQAATGTASVTPFWSLSA